MPKTITENAETLNSGAPPAGLNASERARWKAAPTDEARRAIVKGRVRMEPPEIEAARFAEDKAFAAGPEPACDHPRYREWRARQKQREEGFVSDRDKPAAEIRHDDIAERAFENPPHPEIRGDLDTEALLNGLIAECHLLMREVVLPTAVRAFDFESREKALRTAMSFAVTGATVAKTVARLRGVEQTKFE